MRMILFICLTAFLIAGCSYHSIRTPDGEQIKATVEEKPASLTDAEIENILKQRIDVYEQSVGIVAGLIDSNGRRIIAHGIMDINSEVPVDGNTLFEIGSMSKVFTALILADMSISGEVDLNDPIDKYLPADISMPDDNDKNISLNHLTTHTSGLPRLPDNLDAKDFDDPYANYSEEQMLDFLKRYKLTRGAGEKYEYSNYGAGLLGYLLSQRAGESYEELLISRITEPLNLDDTCISVTEDKQDRFAIGHNAGLEAVGNWNIPTLAGAGAIRSTANDILDFLSANMEPESSPFSEASKLLQTEWIETGIPGLQIGKGWHLINKKGTEIIFHDGGTGGYRTFMGFNPVNNKAAVVLSNAANEISDIGLHIINPDIPLKKLQPPRREKDISTEVYKDYIGEYELAPEIIITVTTEEDRLFAQLTGQSCFRVYPESESDFFFKVVDAQITFVRDNEGSVTHLVLHQYGVNQRAEKRKEEGVPLHARKEIKVEAEVLERYIGEYELTPETLFTITKKEDKLFAGVTGQPGYQIYPESELKFFFKVANAHIEFKLAENGNVEGLTLFQPGRELFAKKKI